MFPDPRHPRHPRYGAMSRRAPFALTGRGWGVGKRVLVSAKSEESPLALTGKQKEPPHALLVSAKGGGAGRPGR